MARGDNPNSRANLKVPTSKEARVNGAKGGKASQKAQKARKTLREELIALLSDGNTQEKISVSLIAQALEGNTKAFEVIRDTIGEKPVERVEQTNIEISVEFEEDDENKDT